MLKSHSNPNPKPSPPSLSCLLQSLHRLISDHHLSSALSLLPLLSRSGLRPPLPLLSSLLSLTLRSRSLPLAKSILLYIRLTHPKPIHPLLSNRIISLHFALNHPDDARNLFDKMPTKNIFTYNAMLAGYTQLGMLNAAKRLFDRMPVKDLISWNTMIVGLARNEQFHNAVDLYVEVRRLSIGYSPQTFSGVLTACVMVRNFRLTQQVHGQVLVVGFLCSNLVIGSCLVDGYAKGGWLEDAKRVFNEMGERDVMCWTSLVYGYARMGELERARGLFERMPERNSVSWTALIGGYARFGCSMEAMDLFGRMGQEGFQPDQFTFSSGLCACAAIGSLRHGRQIHARLLRTHFRANAIVMSSLVDVYSKCGDLEGGRRVFDRTPVRERDTVMWNTMMSAEGQHGHRREAIRLFEEMVGVGTKPDRNTFLVLLSACRVGYIEEAVTVISKIRCQYSTRAWNALLGNCRTHRNMQLRSEVASSLIEVDPPNYAPCVCVSHICVEDGWCESEEKASHLMEGRRVGGEHAAVSWIQTDNLVHFFGEFDQMHPLKEDIYSVLEHLDSLMEDNSFVT